MEMINPYWAIIGLSLIIILSYFFHIISKKTNIPSVLMLIVLGIILKFALDAVGGGSINFFPILEVLGIVGLIMIVLEAALENPSLFADRLGSRPAHNPNVAALRSGA